MACSFEFIEYLANQLCYAGDITYKKLFGEYGLYCDGIFFGCACDNQFFVKVTQAGKEKLHEVVMAPMYKGAKDSFLIEQLEDREYLASIIQATCSELVLAQEKKLRKKKEKI